MLSNFETQPTGLQEESGDPVISAHTLLIV